MGGETVEFSLGRYLYKVDLNPTTTLAPQSTVPTWAVYAGVAAVVVLGVTGVIVWRRRCHSRMFPPPSPPGGGT